MICYQLYAVSRAKCALHVYLAAVIVLRLAVAGTTQTKSEANALVQSGRQQLQDARKTRTEEGYQKAEATLTQALQLAPNNTIYF